MRGGDETLRSERHEGGGRESLTGQEGGCSPESRTTKGKEAVLR